MSARGRLELDELSRIGFGCYRVDNRVAVHREALSQALGSGCNLIDTASSYMDGRSEELVGDVLEATRSRAFVVTKAGYVSPTAALALERAGVRVNEVLALESGTPFSIDPTVLRVLLDLSRARLRRRMLDAVLLHNPERLAETGASAADIRRALESSLAFLEDEVGAGRLRFYGVSSNLLPSAGPGDPLDLETLMELTGRSEALAFVQFPLNLLERQAATAGERPSLLARSGRVRTLVNRPLNALLADQPVRLAATEDVVGEDPWDECVELVAAQLASLDVSEPWSSFRPMQFLRDNRDDIPDPELVDAIWDNQIDPFLKTLFGEDPSAMTTAAFAALHTRASARARTQLAAQTHAAIARLAEEGLLHPQSDEPLAVSACRYCIEAGADHVLVGMRRPEYVAQLAPLFNARRHAETASVSIGDGFSRRAGTDMPARPTA